ncbi:apolipoprotein L3 isoform X2 [Latimeria chalumnae]|nr:PREDICTED: apolipoprotein L3-like [Latimeria chalumnae]|eukprot:XP_006010643.1 PREDICTED: apolipoprotein L3-like [Latimeria chalumnae]
MATIVNIKMLEMVLLEIRSKKQKFSKQEIIKFDISETAYKIQQFYYYIYNFDHIFDKWVNSRKETIQKLRELAEEIQSHRENVNIAQVSGASVGIVGGGLAIAGLILAPFTVGVSLGLTAAGVATGAAGGLTSWGANLVEGGILKDRQQQIQEVLKRDEFQSKEVRNILNVNDLSNRLQELLGDTDFTAKWKMQEVTEQILNKMIEMLKMCLKFKDIIQQVNNLKGKESVFATINNISSVANLSRVLARRGTRTVVQGARIFGIALSAVFILVDVITIAETAIDLSNGSPSQVVENLKVIADELETEMEKMEYCVKRFKQLAEEYKCATGNFTAGGLTF